jgi:restriction system protein
MVVDDDGVAALMMHWQAARRMYAQAATQIVETIHPGDEVQGEVVPPAGGAELLLQAAIVQLGAEVGDGAIVEAVAIPWDALARELQRDPSLLHRFDWRKMEELIAAAYREEGFDVTLTPGSGDYGRDVIATRPGRFSIRIIDQVKAFAPKHLVSANDVRAMLGVLSGDRSVSKAYVTTTSGFAPLIRSDPFIEPFLPHRLELRGGDDLKKWIDDLARKRGR